MARPEKEVATDTRRGLTRPTHLERWKSDERYSSRSLVDDAPAACRGGRRRTVAWQRISGGARPVDGRLRSLGELIRREA
jgi:hypothetical protein